MLDILDNSSVRSDITATMEYVTPELARHYLKRSPQNRPLSNSYIKGYMKSMSAGAWPQNGESIKFNTKNELVDGHHRLHACVRVGIGFHTLVVRGVPDDAFLTIDTGRNRTVGTSLHLTGFKNANVVAAACRVISSYKNGEIHVGGNRRQSANDAMILLQQMPFIEELASKVKSSQLKNILGSGVATGAWALFHEHSPDTAESFFTQLANGAGLSPDSPIYMLRERLIKDRGNKKIQVSAASKLTLCIRAWNAYTSGLPIKSLRGLVEGRTGEFSYPEIE